MITSYEEALRVAGETEDRLVLVERKAAHAVIELHDPDKLNAAMKEARNDGTCPWLRPDTKTQVTVEYKHDGGAVVPLRVDTVVVSAQHSPDITTEQLRTLAPSGESEARLLKQRVSDPARPAPTVPSPNA